MDLSLPFARPYRIRFDEAGADGCVRPSAIVRYLQDLAWHHSEAAGLDRAWYAARNMGWLVRGLELAIVGDAGYGETVTVTTRIAGFRRMWARRHSEVLAADGSTVATASIDWVLLSTAGHPIRIPPEMQSHVSASSPFTPVRIDLDEPPPDAATLRSIVRPSDVDPMGHVNNAAYLDILDELVTAASGRSLTAPASVALEYLHPALPGMTLEATSWATQSGTAFRLRAVGASTDLLRATVT